MVHQPCIATTTFSKTMDLRANLACQMVGKASNLGYPIVVVDGGSCNKFRNKMQDLGATLYDQQEKGMGNSRRQCIREAAHAGHVFWMEPEKHTLVGLLDKICDEMEKTNADIVVPARKSLASYPPIQRAAERLGNTYFAKATGCKLDVWIGPRLIGPKAIKYFLDYKDEYGGKWDSIFIPIIRAIKDGLKVVGCEVDYIHPAEQTAAEETDPYMDEKRFVQLQNLVPAFYAEARKLGLIK